MIAWANPGPARQMGSGGKLLHVDSNLCENGTSGPVTDARNRTQQDHGFFPAEPLFGFWQRGTAWRPSLLVQAAFRLLALLSRRRLWGSKPTRDFFRDPFHRCLQMPNLREGFSQQKTP